MTNTYIEHINEIAKIGLEGDRNDWHAARIKWEAANWDKAATTTIADVQRFYAYVDGKIDADGNQIQGKPLRFKLDENGDAVRV